MKDDSSNETHPTETTDRTANQAKSRKQGILIAAAMLIGLAALVALNMG